jgi:hypothetical protein
MSSIDTEFYPKEKKFPAGSFDSTNLTVYSGDHVLSFDREIGVSIFFSTLGKICCYYHKRSLIFVKINH